MVLRKYQNPSMVHRSRPNSPARAAAAMVPAETRCELPLLLVLLYDGVDVADADFMVVAYVDSMVVAYVDSMVVADADSVVDGGPVGIEVAEYMFINHKPPQASLLLPTQAELQPVGFGRPGF